MTRPGFGRLGQNREWLTADGISEEAVEEIASKGLGSEILTQIVVNLAAKLEPS